MGRQESGGKPGLDLQAESKLHVLELSWGEPERVANCIWNAHTDMQLFELLWLHGHELSLTVKP